MLLDHRNALLLLLGALVPLLYIFVGYPALLRLIIAWRGARTVRREAIEPTVSLVISAYNEAAVIREKLDNAPTLEYPA